MNKKFFLILLATTFCLSLFAQDAVLNIARRYYRHNPFNQPFSKFISSLAYDSTILNKSMHLRTDTSLFFLKGQYDYFNPFGNHIKKIDISLSEHEILFNDSLSVKDTVLIYQLLATGDNNLKNQKKLQKEFEKIQQICKNDFDKDSVEYIKNNDTVTGIIRNYYYYYSAISPLTIAWGQMNDKEIALIITIRIFIRENNAYIPRFYTPGKKS